MSAVIRQMGFYGIVKAENGGRWSVTDFDKFVGGLGGRIQEPEEDLS